MTSDLGMGSTLSTTKASSLLCLEEDSVSLMVRKVCTAKKMLLIRNEERSVGRMVGQGHYGHVHIATYNRNPIGVSVSVSCSLGLDDD